MTIDKIKSEISKFTLNYAKINKLAYNERNSAIIFNQIEENFYGKSYSNIHIHAHWLSRLNKRHSQVPGAFEMQSSNSSDALLMNVFCHPDISKWQGLRKLFNISDLEITGFGIHAIVNKSGKPETKPTEIDLILNNNIICEAKLTEKDFTNKNKLDVEKYDHFEDLFNKSFLKVTNTEYENYQLIRNILALYQGYNRFILFCDDRRTDLILRFIETVSCIKDITLRSKCSIITWQQISSVVGIDLRNFLDIKYGIN